MKKAMLLVTVALVCVAMASPAFAEATFAGQIGNTAPVSTQIGGATYVPSTGVYVSVASIATLYCVTSVHNSSLGNTAGRAYGSTSDKATIFSVAAPSAASTITCADPVAGTIPALPGTGWQ